MILRPFWENATPNDDEAGFSKVAVNGLREQIERMAAQYPLNAFREACRRQSAAIDQRAGETPWATKDLKAAQAGLRHNCRMACRDATGRAEAQVPRENAHEGFLRVPWLARCLS